MKHTKQNRRLWQVMGVLLFMMLGISSCKTGKGCDCPTFGYVEYSKVSHE